MLCTFQFASNMAPIPSYMLRKISPDLDKAWERTGQSVFSRCRQDTMSLSHFSKQGGEANFHSQKIAVFATVIPT